MEHNKYSRREAIKFLGLSGAGMVLFPALFSYKGSDSMMLRSIPSSDDKLPIVGLGTWQTFDVGSSVTERQIRKLALIEMNKYGGSVIDSSPMYGSSESVVGDITNKLNFADNFFYATKVWTTGKDVGILQMEKSMDRMKRKKMDLIQVHNLQDWKTHMKTLKNWKETGKIKYWGITHYVDSAHDELEKIIKSESPDFVQFNYSIRSRNAEKSLFDTAKKHKTATIINQPYESGTLFGLVKGKKLPDWCKEYDINSWGQFFLKFILSNEAVTCVIPGTSKPKHIIDNMMSGYGKLPDNKTREKMVKYLKTL